MTPNNEDITNETAELLRTDTNLNRLALLADRVMGVEADDTSASLVSYAKSPYNHRQLSVTIGKADDGALDISSTLPSPSAESALPNPDREMNNPKGIAAFGMQYDIENHVLQQVAIQILHDNRLPINSHNISSVVLAMTRGWLDGIPRNYARRLRGRQHLRNFDSAVSSILDKETYHTLKDTGGATNTGNYNRVIKGGTALVQLRDTNPLAYAWISSRFDYEPEGNYEHPGQIVSEVRTTLEENGLQKSSWKRASQLDIKTINKIIAQPATPTEVALILNAAAKYNTGNPTVPNLSLIHISEPTRPY